MVQIVLAAGTDLKSADRQLTQIILTTAIRGGNLDIVELLIDEGIDLKVEKHDSYEDTPLQFAINEDKEQMVDLLISSGYLLTATNIKGLTALHSSSNSSYTQKLIKAGAPINLPGGRRGFTPLQHVVEKGWLDAARVLLDSGAETTIQEKVFGYIPLHTAIIQGQRDIIDLLLKYNPRQQVEFITDGFASQNCLHLAAQYQCPVVQLLIAAGAKTDVQDKNQNTPLMWAIKCKNITCALEIIKFTPDLEIVSNFSATDKEGDCILHSACQVDKCHSPTSIVSNLISKLPDLSFAEKINCLGESPLMVAAKNDHLDVVNLLVQHGVDMNVTNSQGGALHLALSGSHKDITLALLSSEKVKLDICDKSGETVLHKAATSGELEVIKALIDRGLTADLINRKASNGCTALHYLVENASDGISSELLIRLAGVGADMNATNSAQDTPLIRACRSKQDNTSYVREVIKLGGSVNAINAEGRSPMHYACSSQRTNVAQILIDNGGDCNQQDNLGNTPVHIAAIIGLEDLVRYMLTKAEPRYNLDSIGQNGKTLLHYATALRLESTFDLCISLGAKVDVLGSAPSPLIHACRGAPLSMVKVLLELGANVNLCDTKGCTPLMWAASQDNVDCINLLLKHEADPLMVDKAGDTALTKAAWRGHNKALEVLIPVYPDLNDTENEEGMSALHLAVAKEHSDCVRLLLDAGADINLVDHHGNTTLLSAAMLTKGTKILEMILNSTQGYDINAVGDKGRTALHWSVGEPESVELLLWYKPDLDVLDGNRASPLLLAIAHKQPESAKLLIKAGCKIDMPLEDGRCPIHHAAVYGDTETTQLLIERGINPDSPMKDARRPILIAAIENHADVLETLLQHKVAIDHIYFDAFTALSMAVSKNYIQSVKVLLDHGANPAVIGSKKHPPLTHAILKDFREGVVALIQAGADFDKGLDDDKHPIQVSVVKSNSKILQILLEVGIQPHILRAIVQKGVIDYFLDNERQVAQIRELAKQPLSLCGLCRQVLRKKIRLPLVRNVNRTSLPQSLQEYVCYSELNSIFK